MLPELNFVKIKTLICDENVEINVKSAINIHNAVLIFLNVNRLSHINLIYAIRKFFFFKHTSRDETNISNQVLITTLLKPLLNIGID